MTDTDPILPRELTDLSDEIRNVPPPPSSADAPEPYAWRLVNPDADAEMVSEWMNRPYLVETWESDWSPARWHRYLKAQIDGDYSRPFIGSVNGKDGGYVELYRAAKDSIATRYVAEPHDLGMHAAIADLSLMNKGVAPYLLPYFVAGVLSQEPQCRRIMFDPDHGNKMARRFLEKAGCVLLGEHDMSNRRMALYVLARSPEDVPKLR